MLKKFVFILVLLTFMVISVSPLTALSVTGTVNKLTAAKSATSTNAVRTGNKLILDPVCMQNAVEKRDSAIITASDAYYTTVKASLENRKSALKTAWSITDRKERRSALKTAWTNFTKTKKTATITWRKAKSSAWKQFKLDLRACGSTAASDDYTSEGADAQP
ncbi:hypothetical protein COW09_01635 [bacterium (Candidatus Moisslbacteria) CG12_big_fil_rev_8_21_14_0_65_36_11]|nr:hypothetical protein [Candidatus Kuenenbacteria bacterium]OIP77145.1 MAG: hypothetical protein AUK09_00455 [Parcubacteria group bacterium CG2_30_36_38]PIW67775.1 MAG: hypothetical protein COW09_01635 [bacterium (Candidatus Moisslbacteria) CG12_big_fil_rev_8_21_14_0_65_36_11]PIZ90361.1 MAG: hypothetical protein COX87_00940 [bacterium (Candidatus Moisslbacteria) CG_4_10_14_0_2_um_filter_36_61]PJC00586.1 MAG: hypothetical protein CO074_01785 [bacterium (Candidatus Moisslbacteria) CG_4_9_14_0_8_